MSTVVATIGSSVTVDSTASKTTIETVDLIVVTSGMVSSDCIACSESAECSD